MRAIYIIPLFLVLSAALQAQDTLTVYYNTKWVEISDKDAAAYYRKAFVDSNGKWTANDYYISGKIQMTGTYRDRELETRNGHFVYYYENGNKEAEGDYVNNKREGNWTSWHENGNKANEGMVSRDEDTGEWKYWYENGQLQAKGSFVKDLKDGTWSYWYDNGQLMSIEELSKGEMVSDVMYHENGELEYKGGYVKGEKEGEWTYWNVDGRMTLQGNYHKGNRHGKWTRYFPGGQMEINYLDGMVLGRELGGIVTQ